MENAMTGADLAFLLCGIIVTLGALFVWAIASVERSPLMVRIRQTARQRIN